MAKSKKEVTTTEVVAVEGGVVERITAADVRKLAQELNVNLDQTLEERADEAADRMNMSQRNFLAAGLILLSMKADCQYGEFLPMLQARGFEERAAQRAMMYASYVAEQPEHERERLLAMPKSKLMLLAAADPEVVEALSQSGESIDTLSVRALQEKIRDLEAAVADRDVRLETAEAEAKAAKKASKKDRDSEVPVAIFDIRAEAVAQVEKAHLAVEEVQALGRDLTNLIGVDGVYQWVDPTARLAITGLLALQVQIDGVLKQLKDAFDLEDVKPAPMSYLVPVEVEEIAKRFADLIALHEHEKALRDWERQQERPRGKGRPASKPEAPKTRGE